MGRLFSLVRRGLSLPGTLLWKGYRGLWWAFGDPSAAADEHASNRLHKTLRVGFGSTVAASALVALTALAAAENGAFSPLTAWWLWGWASLLAAVISIWAVKHVARQQALRNPAGLKDHAGAAAAGFADMGREVAGAAVKAKDATLNAGRHVGHATRATAEYARRVKGWVNPRAG